MVNLNINPPEGFLDEELRDGYLVSAKMKKVWAVEIDLLYEFQRVCKKHNIKYVANGGTMLGAIRHKGFIPWDDDVDIMMLRPEYEKLCKLADEFKHPYFLQTEKTDPGTLRGHAQLRNSETTAFLKHEFLLKRTFNQGIFIDIFPMDSIPNNIIVDKIGGMLQVLFKKSSSLFANLSVRKSTKNMSHIRRAVHKLFYRPNFFLMDLFYNMYEFVISHVGPKNGDKVATLILFYKEKYWRKKEWLEDVIEVPFEYITVNVSRDYDAALTKFCGDWRTPVKKVNMHGGAHYDPDRPYTYYTEDGGVLIIEED